MFTTISLSSSNCFSSESAPVDFYIIFILDLFSLVCFFACRLVGGWPFGNSLKFFELSSGCSQVPWKQFDPFEFCFSALLGRARQLQSGTDLICPLY